jgi:hypothetical protein
VLEAIVAALLVAFLACVYALSKEEGEEDL